MSKQLKFTYGEKQYCLEFTRKSIEQMEKNGFVISDIESKPMTILPALFAGAFIANHRFVKPETINEIYSKMTNKGDLIGKLAEMYNEPIATLFDDPDESEGNLDWTASW